MDNTKSQFNRFTMSARSALARAQEETQRRGQAEIEPEHLLLGLLRDPGNTACELLRAGGVTPEQARNDVEGLLPPALPPEQVTRGEIRLGERAKQVVVWAVEECHLSRQSDLVTGHLLLGLLREERIGQLFAIWEINLEAARTTMAHLSPERAEREKLPASATAATQQLADQRGPASTPTGMVELDVAQQERVRQVTRRLAASRRVFTLALVLSVVAVVLAFLLIPDLSWRLFLLYIQLLTIPVLGWQPIEGWTPLLEPLIGLAIGAGLSLFVLPYTWYNSQVILKRSGLATTNAWRWLRGLGLSFLRFYCSFCLLIEVMDLLHAIQPQAWWAWTALVSTLFSVILGGLVGTYSVFWTGRRLTPLREGPVVERFQSLLQRLGLPACPLYQLKVASGSRLTNAYFAGWGRGRRVVLTDTMFARFTLDEIEVILAHELGHFAHHDIWTRYLLNGLTLLGFLGLFQLEVNVLPLLILPNLASPDSGIFSDMSQPFGPVLALLVLSGCMLARRRYIRYQEDRADEYALRATNNVQAFKNAMTRLVNANLILATPGKGQNARPRGTHPTLLRRLQHADDYAARQNPVSRQQTSYP